MFFILLGLGMTVLIPFMPQLLRLRIRLLRWMHLETLARFFDKRFNETVLFLRLLVAAIAITLFGLALAA